MHLVARRREVGADRLRRSRRSAGGWMTATRRTPSPSRPGSSPSRPVPTTTSYGRVGRRPRIRVAASRHRAALHDLVGDVVAGSRPSVARSASATSRVERAACVHQLLELAAHVAQQQRPRRARPTRCGRLREADVEEDDRVAGSRSRVSVVEDRAAAERQHAVVLGSAAATAARSSARKCGSPSSTKMSRDRLPASASMSCVGVAERRRRSRSASSAPTVDLPDPGGPTRTSGRERRHRILRSAR